MAVKIIWSNQAKQAVKDVYDYYKKVSVQGATNVRNDISNAPKTIRYTKQYQIDDVYPSYRRIVVRGDYKVLYSENNNIINIVDVVATKQSTTY